jgi:hypothetical protein
MVWSVVLADGDGEAVAFGGSGFLVEGQDNARGFNGREPHCFPPRRQSWQETSTATGSACSFLGGRGVSWRRGRKRVSAVAKARSFDTMFRVLEDRVYVG